MEIVAVTAHHRQALVDFAQRIPERDRGFLDRSLLSQVAVAGWTQAVPERRLVAVDEDRVRGLVTVAPGTGWMSHVGELRLVVAPTDRGHGLGRTLAERALALAATMDLQKMTVEMVAINTGARAMFTALDFSEEARLAGQVRDGTGELQDVVIFSRWL